jgi:hypothetical protein
VKLDVIPVEVVPFGKVQRYERGSLSGSVDPLAEKFTRSGRLPAVGLAEILATG